jgi:hypothetical protein
MVTLFSIFFLGGYLLTAPFLLRIHQFGGPIGPWSGPPDPAIAAVAASVLPPIPCEIGDDWVMPHYLLVFQQWWTNVERICWSTRSAILSHAMALSRATCNRLASPLSLEGTALWNSCSDGKKSTRWPEQWPCTVSDKKGDPDPQPKKQTDVK